MSKTKTEDRIGRLPFCHPRRVTALPDQVGAELIGLLTGGFPHTCWLHSAGTRMGLVVNGRRQTPMEGYSGKSLAQLTGGGR
jgi:hypothetical protein